MILSLTFKVVTPSTNELKELDINEKIPIDRTPIFKWTDERLLQKYLKR